MSIRSKVGFDQVSCWKGCPYFLAFALAPLDHSLSSAAAALASASACFWVAASAFWRKQEDRILALLRRAQGGARDHYLCVSSDLLGILAALFACHDDQVCGDVHDDEDSDIWVDRVWWHSVMTRVVSKILVGLRDDWDYQISPCP
jgi:hypothetical protein